MIINDATKLGSGSSNLILETAGRVYIKVADRFYELDFKNQGGGDKIIYNTSSEAPEVDMSQYVTKKYLKSALNSYITQRGWEDVKETKKMLENALLQGFTESINPITIETMQMIVGTESLQFEFIEGLLIDNPRSAGFELLDGNGLKCPNNYIKHLTIDGPSSVRPDTPIQYYSRWSVEDTSSGSDGNTYLTLSDDNLSYYVYIRAPKYINPSTQEPYEDSYIDEHLVQDPKGSGVATYILSRTALELEPTDDPGYYYFLVALITSKSNGVRSIGYMNGFTEVVPGQITAYIFKTREGDQYIDFLDKRFHIGYPAEEGELSPTGTVNNGSYMHWDVHNGLVIKGSITVTGGDLQETLDNLQRQIDDEIQAWFSDDINNDNVQRGYSRDCVPTVNTWPAHTWAEYIDPETEETVESVEKDHIGDLFYIVDGTYKGHVYRFIKNSATELFEWIEVEDNAVAIALEMAHEAKTLSESNQNKINNLIDDGMISPIEIEGIREELAFITSDYADLYKQADLFGLTDQQSSGYSTYLAYNNAKTLYNNWLTKIIYAYDNPTFVPSSVIDSDGNVSLAGCEAEWPLLLTDHFSNAMSSYYTTRTALCQVLATSIHTEIHGLDYIKNALTGDTRILGGLVLTNLLAMRDINNDGTQGDITAGINGIVHDKTTHTDIGAWYGGEMIDKESYYDWDNSTKTWVLETGKTDPGSIAKTIFRHNGSGYFADGNIWWGSDGSGRIPGVSWSNTGVVTLDPNSQIGSTGKTLANIGDFFELVSDTSGSTPKYYVHLKSQYTINNTTYQIQGLASDGFITAAGVGSSSGGGGGGADLGQVWQSLQNAASPVEFATNLKFHQDHLPATGTGLAYTTNADGLATGIGIASDYKLPTTTEWGNKADASALSSYLPLLAGSGNGLTNSLYTPGIQLTGLASGRSFGMSSSESGTNIDLGWNYTDGDGAGIGLVSSSNSSSPGVFNIYARSGSSSSKVLSGTPSGSLTWDGNTLYHAGNFVAGTNYQTPLSQGTGITISGSTISVTANTYAPYNANGYLPKSAGTDNPLSGVLKIAPSNTSGVQDGILLHDAGTGASEGLRIKWTSATYGTGVSLYPNSDLSGLTVDGSLILTAGNYSSTLGSVYLPLSAGSTKPLTGTLYIQTGGGIADQSAGGMLAFHPTDWTGVSNTQWGVGTTCEGVIRSSNTDLLHYRGTVGTSSIIYDAGNSNKSDVAWACSSLTVGSTSASNPNIAFPTSLGTAYVATYNGKLYFGANTYGLHYDLSSQFIGIGDSSPLAKLHVLHSYSSAQNVNDVAVFECRNSSAGKGSAIRLANTGLGGYSVKIAAVNEQESPSYLNPAMVFYTMNNTYERYTEVERMRLTSAGNLMIGLTSDSGHKLDVDGVIHATTGVQSPGYGVFAASASSSDARLKDGIVSISPERAWSVLMQLKPREWTWNVNYYQAGKRGAGLVAQEVEPILPFSVLNEDKYLHLNYDVMHGFEIAGLQNHETRLRQAEREITNLKRENAELKERLSNN